MWENYTYQGVRHRRAADRLGRKTPGGHARLPCMLILGFSASTAMLFRAAACRLLGCSGTHQCPPTRPGNNTNSAYRGSYSVRGPENDTHGVTSVYYTVYHNA